SLGEPMLLRSGRQVLDEKTGETDDSAQQIVEIVRDTAGELADGFHLARLLQMKLQALAVADLRFLLGDVFDHRDDATSGQPRPVELEIQQHAVSHPGYLVLIPLPLERRRCPRE